MARQALFSRLPEIWRRLDADGVLERYLGVWDFELDAVHAKITELLTVRNVDVIPDRFLYLLADFVGHEWRSDKTKLWNRDRIRSSIRRWSRKGSYAALDALVQEHGGGDGYTVTDNASKLLVLGKQGRLSYEDAYLVSADYYHDGAFVLSLTEDIDFAAFVEDFRRYVAAAGEKWTFQVSGQQDVIFEAVWSDSTTASEFQIDPEGALGFGILGISLFLSTEPNGKEAFASSPIYWQAEGNYLNGAIGYGHLGLTLFLSTEPSGSVEDEGYLYEEGIGGGSFTLDTVTKLDKTSFDLGIDSNNPLPTDAALIQEDGEIS